MSEFTAIEQTALDQAQSDGWLTLTAEMRDILVTHWQRQCASAGRPFAVLRVDPRRASLWLFPSADGVWTEQELTFFHNVLANERGVVLSPLGIRAFVSSGHESTVMNRLLGATSGTIYRASNPRVVSLVARIRKPAPKLSRPTEA
jgi:hypothetical protein